MAPKANCGWFPVGSVADVEGSMGPVEHSRRDWCPVQRSYLSGDDPALPSCSKCGGWFASELSATSTPKGTSLDDRISSLDVSDKWKERFRNVARVRRASAGQQSNYRPLDAETRKAAISLNFPAFFLGFVYYFIKGMHRRGLVGIGAVLLYIAGASWVEAALDRTLPTYLFWVPGSAVAAMLANADFFDTRIEGLNMWPALRRLDGWFASGLVAAVGLVGLALVTLKLAVVTVSDVEAVLERELRDRIGSEVEVACPGDAAVREGDTFECIVTAGGEVVPIQVTMVSNVDFEWSEPDLGGP